MKHVVILFSLLTAAFLLMQWQRSITGSLRSIIKSDDSYKNEILNFRLPDTMMFCSERLPLEKQEVREQMEREFYATLHSNAQIILILKQAGRSFPFLEERLQQAGLPDDIKYLVVAESGLRNVVSPKGAAGLWQVTEDAARVLGLEVNYWIDERFHLEKATDAAIKYLKTLYERFHSWTLAAAAYNAGPENIDDNIKFQWEDNYYDLFLNEETSRYIFRIAALKEIVSHSEKYGFVISKEELYKPRDVKQVEVNSAIPNLALWAKEQGTTYKEIRMLNPWILKRKLPKGRYVIAVPCTSSPKRLDLSKYDYGEVKYEDEPGNKHRRK